MTNADHKVVTPLGFESWTKEKVITNEYSTGEPDKISHISIGESTDIAVVAPATANGISKMANGLADDVVSTTLLATKVPIFIVPAMNPKMLNNPATQRNLNFLVKNGDFIMDPANGFLAEGYQGKGRMPEPEDIFQWIDKKVNHPGNQPLLHKKIIVTAGGTRENIDPVRYITNRSSGKMGFAVAQAASNQGADVTLIAANTTLPVNNKKIDFIPVSTTQEMFEAVSKKFVNSDGLIMAAAISDFRPETIADKKIKKQPGQDTWTLKLIKNPDIIKTVGKTKRKDQFLVGFAAETNDLLANANKKISEKNLDMIVANDVSNPKIGFGSDENQVTFIFKDGNQQRTKKLSKVKIAEELIHAISKKILKVKDE